jgi:hypothetical protein
LCDHRKVINRKVDLRWRAAPVHVPPLILAIAFLWVSTATPGQPFQAAPAAVLPPRLEAALSTIVRATPSERRLLLSGAPVTKFLDADPNVEVAVFAAVWINASPRLYVNAVRDIENFERGRSFLVTKRISTPPRLEDFARLRLTAEDLKDLKNCRVGDCQIKLGEQALKALRSKVDWREPTAEADAEAVFRRVAFDYVTGYLEGGNARLAVYRDGSKPTFVETEFRSMVDRMPELTSGLPELRRYLVDYPNVPPSGMTDFLYWQEVRFGLKPTIRISHLVIEERDEGVAVASKMLYASHYFWTALELRVLVPDPARGPGFWFVTVNRSRSDGLSGFTGRIIRGRVRDEVQKGTIAVLTATKSKLEAQAR